MKLNDTLVSIVLNGMLVATLIFTFWAGVFMVTKIIECMRYGIC